MEHPNGYPNTCLVIEHFLEEQFPEEYAARKRTSLSKSDSETASTSTCTTSFILSSSIINMAILFGSVGSLFALSMIWIFSLALCLYIEPRPSYVKPVSEFYHTLHFERNQLTSERRKTEQILKASLACINVCLLFLL